jgi:hypothetical protein
VDLVDEQDVVLLEVGQQRRQVLGLFQHRARGLAQVDAQLVGDDVRQRGLAQAGRAEQQHVVERLAALLGGADEDLELLARLGLAHVVGQQLGPQGALDRLFVGRGGRGGHHALRRRHLGGRNRRSGSSLAPFSPFWVGTVIVLAGLSEFAGALGPTVGASRRYDGPLGKSDRAFVFGALGLYVALGGPLPGWTAWLLPLLAALVAWTTANRIRRALAEADAGTAGGR